MRKRCCIKCGEDLSRRDVAGVGVDLCPTCGGLWLDRRELQQLAAMPEQVAELLALQRPKAEGGPPSSEAAERSRLDSPCPACGGKLALAVVGGVNLEMCNACGGVFLDAEELGKATAEVERREGFQLASVAALARSVSTRGTIGD